MANTQKTTATARAAHTARSLSRRSKESAATHRAESKKHIANSQIGIRRSKLVLNKK